ncbi:MAG: DUF2125 domain-containing protein [Rubellimicrobium sp.]|nr:DUF2125 domain-containing protein [Rubellimicrobium sp.]
MIRALTGAVVALAMLWAGWWFVAAQAAGRGIERVVTDLRAAGWQVDYADLATRGFPSRIDTTLEALVLADPDRRVTWEIPALNAFALSYRPNEVIVTWPREQAIALPGQRLVLDADGLTGSARVGVAADLPLRAVILQSDLVTLASDAGWRAGASHLLAALHETGRETAPGSYELFAELQELTLPALAGGPDSAGVLRVDATLRLDRPLALNGPSRVEGVTLREARAAWGAASVALRGEVTADEGGFAQGSVMLELRDWPQLLAALAGSGLVAPEDIERAGDLLRLASSGDTTLNAPLVLSGGMVLLGGLVPLGQAPRLHD